ncbi:MAG: hypothetical protein ACXWBL_13040 [Usitatibacter sp.]
MTDVRYYHSHNDEGRHWITTSTKPPFQMLPVAPNHFRIGWHLIQRVCEQVRASDAPPASIFLEGGDGAPGASVRLAMLRAPADWGDDADEPLQTLFITPQPPLDWPASYDEWLVEVARALGQEAEPATDREGYERAMEAAYEQVQARIPALRARFLHPPDRLELSLKIGLDTEDGGKEWVWVAPFDWREPGHVGVTIESEPRTEGYAAGDRLTVAVTDVVDFCLGNREQGTVEPGLTTRIAMDYGLVI